MWFAIAITILAASGNNIGKVLQKQATRGLPRLTLKQEIIQQYLSCPTWMAGMFVDLAGALLMIVAFAHAPVSVVQPVSAIGLVILLIFSHFYLKERLKFQEWLAAGVAGCGVLGLGLSAEASHLEHPNFSAMRVLGAFLGLISLLALECWWRHAPSHHSTSNMGPLGSSSGNISSGSGLQSNINKQGSSFGAHQHHPGSGPGGSGPVSAAVASDAVMCGLEAGACFGYSAAACRTGFILAAKLSLLWVPVGLTASVLLTTCGFVLQTRGLKSGNTVVVCTMAATSSMISGVIAGFIALDERLPTGHGMKVLRLVSWACILLGVTSLAGGSEGLAAPLRAVTSSFRLPPWAWRGIPRPIAVVLHRAYKGPGMDGEGEDGGGMGGYEDDAV